MKPKTHLLSKSRYCAGLQCHKLLYYKVHNPELIPKPDAYTQFIFDQGSAVGELATEQYEGGVQIPAFPLDRSVELTKKALKDGSKHIFEAAFNYDDIHVKVDILINHGNDHVEIIEVKSSSDVKDVHRDDMAIQRYVLEGNGLVVDKTCLMHMNSNYRHPEGSLFTISDESAAVDKKMLDIKSNIDIQKSILAEAEAPEMDIGPHCSDPYPCPLKEMCWKHIPKISIFNIPRIKNKWEYYKQGIIEIEQLPATYKETPSQKPFLKAYRSGEAVIDRQGIKRMMSKLSEPIYFMDFETVAIVIPMYDGAKPWQQFPFQWSVHILKDGKVSHHEFLPESKEDPRKEFIVSLLDVIGDRGSVVAYNIHFEKGQLNKIAELFPEYKDRIENVVSRLWDQLDVFRNFYCDAKFGGGNSIKNVLPVMVPNLSYKDLEIQQGDLAGPTWLAMLEAKGEEKDKLRHALLEYCQLDTLAMVEIHKKLKEIIEQ